VSAAKRAADLLSGLVLVGAVVTVMGLAATRPALPAPRGLTEAEQRQVFAELARWEPEARLEAEESFPGDPWSQDDHFHNLEQQRAGRVAARLRTSVGEVLRAIDEGLRQGWSPELPRRATVAPCRPRPFYD
jgi:hypothetical protein